MIALRAAAPGLGLAMTLALAVGPACADIDLAAVETCIEAGVAGAVPTHCVGEAHAGCAAIPDDQPATATACFETARVTWSAAIAERMERLTAQGPAPVAAQAGIEVKYDLLSSLLQCDRMEELAQLRNDPAETINRRKSSCAAAASGLAYVRLAWRARSLE